MNKNLTGKVNIIVFYESSKWHFILKKCIKPLVEELSSQYNSRFSIYLGKFYGAHICLELRNFSANSKTIIRIAFETIKSFIDIHPSPSKGKRQLGFFFFKDFPNNSAYINLNLHKNIRNKCRPTQYEEIDNFITQLVLQVLAAQSINTQSTMSLYLYLIVGAIKATCDDILDAATKVHLLLKFTVPRDVNNKSTENFIESSMLENELIIDEIVNVIFYNPLSKLPKWLVTWIEIIKSKNIRETKHNRTIDEIFNNIEGHLNIEGSAKLLNLIAILKSLNKQLKNSYQLP